MCIVGGLIQHAYQRIWLHVMSLVSSHSSFVDIVRQIVIRAAPVETEKIECC